MRRADQFVLIGSAILLAWLAMMAVHEAGHVLGALLTGGTVKVVVLHPLTISCTVLSHNPHPLLVTRAGPVIGVLIRKRVTLPSLRCNRPEPGTPAPRRTAGQTYAFGGSRS
jgi:hypothetical protein